MFVTEGWRPHVTESQGAFAAAVDEEIAMMGMKLRGSNHFRQVLHIGWLYIYNVWMEVSLRKMEFIKGNYDPSLEENVCLDIWHKYIDKQITISDESFIFVWEEKFNVISFVSRVFFMYVLWRSFYFHNYIHLGPLSIKHFK